MKKRIRYNRGMSARVQRRLLAHRGKWIAVSNGRVLAEGDTVQQVLSQPAVRRAVAPIIYRVPDEDPLPSYCY
jgi:hypothetical protein